MVWYKGQGSELGKLVGSGVGMSMLFLEEWD